MSIEAHLVPTMALNANITETDVSMLEHIFIVMASLTYVCVSSEDRARPNLKLTLCFDLFIRATPDKSKHKSPFF